MGDGVHKLAGVKSPQTSGFDVVGSFGIGAAGAVDTEDIQGRGYTPTKAATAGQYVIQINRPVFGILCAMGGTEDPTLSDLGVQVIASDRDARTVTLQCHAGGVATNPAADNRVHFRIHCVRSQAR